MACFFLLYHKITAVSTSFFAKSSGELPVFQRPLRKCRCFDRKPCRCNCPSFLCKKRCAIVTDILPPVFYNRVYQTFIFSLHFSERTACHAQRQSSAAPPTAFPPSFLWESGGGFLAGLLLAGTHVGAIDLALPIAFAANFTAPGAVSVLIGSLLAYVISGTLLDNLPLLFGLVVVVSLRMFRHPPRTASGMAWSTALCVFLAGIAVSLFFHASGAEVIGYTMTACLTGCASYFMHAVFTSIRASGKIPLRSTDGCAAAVVLILTIAAFSCYRIPAMNVGCILGTAITLVGARKFRCAGGVICGALSACGAVLGAGRDGLAMLVLPVGGLLMATFLRNRFAIAGIFFVFPLWAYHHSVLPCSQFLWSAIFFWAAWRSCFWMPPVWTSG